MSVGLYASPPLVAMAVVGWFLCFPAFFFFFFEKRVFFPIRDLCQKRKRSLRDLHQKKNISITKKTRLTLKKKVTRLTPNKKSELRLFPQSSYAYLKVWVSTCVP